MTRARPRLGQHFLIDEQSVEDIIATIEPCAFLVEIGPGRGALSARLAQCADQLLAIEKDPELARALQQNFAHEPHVTIRCADALEVDLRESPKGLQLVGNLPYNIATALLQHWLQVRTHVAHFTVMVQREVAQRLLAQPGDSSRGQLSVITQLCMEGQAIRDAAPECFDPPPKVMSTVLRLTPRAELPIPESAVFGDFHRLVQSAFAARRKTLRNNLPDLPATLWEHLEIDAGRRAETLSQAEWIRLFHAAQNLAQEQG